MSVNRIKISSGYEFRHFGKNYENTKGIGLYFNSVWAFRKDAVKLPPSEIIRITQWLNRYCAQYLDKKQKETFEFSRAKSRAVTKSIEILEAQTMGFNK